MSLIIGMTLLLLGLNFFTTLFRAARTSVLTAKEEMAMATVAQNMAQVYLATNDEITAENQGKEQGYETVDLSISAGPEKDLKTVTITVNSKIYADPTSPQYIEPYVLVFYTPALE